MAHRCFRSEYFDSLLHACKPCHLRCSNPPVPCQPYCDPSMASSVRETYTVLWIFLGLTLALSLALFTLSFLLRKMNPEMLKDKPQSPGQLDGSVQMDKAIDELTRSRAGEQRTLPRSLEYTVEECTCEDCVKSSSYGDSDHFFPLPAMEEGATILVTTKTGDYSKSSVPSALQSVMGTEKPTHTR
ncbi:tumor necrosis factor receptor superfamily member 17 isoform X2 [Apodemus sylvaticus]|uniref:tumor necrosis factor receptor superfamily member 17 isoform X2 n=1 Tax=Apodemus sylvaticus TaxID=10129 RepID=UPI002241AFC1|nr:tumor necrosis factor receptor superfamily member 17 isoform X2 [Apodemus sylvaticus]